MALSSTIVSDCMSADVMKRKNLTKNRGSFFLILIFILTTYKDRCGKATLKEFLFCRTKALENLVTK